MIPGAIQGATKSYGKPAGMTDDECGSLLVREGHEGDWPTMTSAWYPTPEEVERLRAGAPVYLTIFGAGGHPPVALSVGE